MPDHVKLAHSLCSQCGACAAICPKGAITLTRDRAGNYYPRVDEATCYPACGICATVCAGNGVDWTNLHSWRFDEPFTGAPIGHCLATYSGHAADGNIRNAAASGGMISALLCHLLESNAVDAACVSRLDGFNPVTVLATTPDQIVAATGSVYVCNPALMGLDQIKQYPGRVAFVGLPCHIQTLCKAIQQGVIEPEKVVFVAGIFCGRTATVDLIKSFLLQKGLDPAHVREMKLRGNGWPGTFRFVMRDGTEHEFPFPAHEYMSMWKFYQHAPPHCLVCGDPLARLADISFGDAWLPEFKNDKVGVSVAIARTAIGMEILHRAHAENIVCLTPISPSDILKSQRQQIYSKYTNQRNIRRVARVLLQPLPADKGSHLWPTGNPLGLAYAAFQWGNCLLSRRPFTRWLLRLLPLVTLTKILRKGK